MGFDVTTIGHVLQNVMMITILPFIMVMTFVRCKQMNSYLAEWNGRWQHANNVLWALSITSIIYGFLSIPYLFEKNGLPESFRPILQIMGWLLVLFTTFTAQVLGETPFGKRRQGDNPPGNITYLSEFSLSIANSVAAIVSLVLVLLLYEPTYADSNAVWKVGLAVAIVAALPYLYWVVAFFIIATKLR